ncbi:unnamed protein product, partial [Iphiclides podalirius]
MGHIIEASICLSHHKEIRSQCPLRDYPFRASTKSNGRLAAAIFSLAWVRKVGSRATSLTKEPEAVGQ